MTNLAFYGRVSTSFASPAGNHLGWIVVAVPVIGGLIVGIMARTSGGTLAPLFKHLLHCLGNPVAAVFRSRSRRRAPAIVFDDSTLREAADHMVEESVGRLPVVNRSNPRRVIGIITRSDILSAHKRRLDGVRIRHPKMVRI